MRQFFTPVLRWVLVIAAATILPIASASDVGLPARGASEPPILVIDEATATGVVFRFPGGPAETITISVLNGGAVPRNGRLDVRFHARAATGSTLVAYSAFGGPYVTVSSDTLEREATVDLAPLPPGRKALAFSVRDDHGLTTRSS